MRNNLSVQSISMFEGLPNDALEHACKVHHLIDEHSHVTVH